MSFNVSFDASRVSDRPTFEPITPGEYIVNVEETAEKISRKSGADMVELKLKIIDARDAANKKFVGRTLFYYIVNDQRVMDKISEVFESAAQQIPKQVNAKSFLSLTGTVKTKLEAYNGEQRASVAYWCRPRSGETPPAPPAAPKNSADDIPF